MSDLVYGVVVHGIFYSGRMARRLLPTTPNGVYSMDMNVDDFESSLSPANLSDTSKYLKKVGIRIVRGISFHSGMIPENPVTFPVVPIGVIDPTYDEFEEIEVVEFVKGSYYYLQTLESQKAYVLMDIKEAFSAKNPVPKPQIKGITPEMRIAYTLHIVEKARREREEPVNAVKLMMEETGATVLKVTVTNRGFEVSWKLDRFKFMTIFDKKLKVVNAGYCVNHNDKVLSARSVVNVAKDGIQENPSLIHITLAPDGNNFQDEDDD